MRRADWESRWSEGRTPFHRHEVNEALIENARRAWGEGPRRVLVPLCGKSVDMAYLAEAGAEVVGVEFVERAIREFFDERGLEFLEAGDRPRRLEAGPYTLFAADFFDVAPADAGHLDAAYDRAALIALDPATRVRYAEHLAGLLPPRARVLLVTLEYDQSEMDGPPYAVLPDEVERLFAVDFEVETVTSEDAFLEHFAERGVTAMRESVYVLTRRAA